MKVKAGVIAALIGISGLFAGTVSAVPTVLDSTIQCSLGNQQNGINISDVTGNNGGASDCWGTLDGNDPGPSGDGFIIGSTVFDFVAKKDTPGALEGADIGLTVTPDGGALSGDWAYDPAKFNPSEFLIVLKAANSPGYAAWLFTGADAASFMGTWSVAWNRDLSHLGIYAPGESVPEPSILALFALGLIGIGFAVRRKKR